jgi:uncharacterized membrane protein (DUF106 family)
MINRRFVDREKFAKWQTELNRFNAEKGRVKETKDKKLAAKVRKQEKRMSQMQSKMLKGQMMGTFVSMGFFVVMWQVLSFIFSGKKVAYLPFSIPYVIGELPFELPFYYWYIICSLVSSTILSRIFGKGMGMGMGMQPQTTE